MVNFFMVGSVKRPQSWIVNNNRRKNRIKHGKRRSKGEKKKKKKKKKINQENKIIESEKENRSVRSEKACTSRIPISFSLNSPLSIKLRIGD